MPLRPRAKDEERRHGRSPGCCLGALFVSVTLLLGAYVLLNATPDLQIPHAEVPAQNAYDDIVKSGQMAFALKQKPPDPMPAAPPSELKSQYAALAREAAPIVSLVRSSLQKKYVAPPCRTFAAVIDNTGPKHLRLLSRTVRACADAALEAGNDAGSVEILLDGLEMSVAAATGEPVDAVLVILACEQLFEAPLEQRLAGLSAPQLAHVAARMERIATRRVHYADVVLEEGYAQTAAFEDLMSRSGKNGLRSFSNVRDLIVGEEKRSLTWRERKQIAAYMLTRKSAILKENLDYFVKFAAEIRKPRKARKSIPFPTNLLANYEIGIVGAGQSGELKRKTVFAVLRTEVALKRYRLATGGYPDTLQALCPRYLDAVPLDPFSETGTAELNYTRLAADRYRLYGEGPDSGQPDVGAKPQAGDIVAGRLAGD